jgi:uncharacterized membrane protein
MTKGVFWLLIGLVNVYLAAFMQNDEQQIFSLVVALYCGVLAIWYFYRAAKGVK